MVIIIHEPMKKYVSISLKKEFFHYKQACSLTLATTLCFIPVYGLGFLHLVLKVLLTLCCLFKSSYLNSKLQLTCHLHEVSPHQSSRGCLFSLPVCTTQYFTICHLSSYREGSVPYILAIYLVDTYCSLNIFVSLQCLLLLSFLCLYFVLKLFFHILALVQVQNLNKSQLKMTNFTLKQAIILLEAKTLYKNEKRYNILHRKFKIPKLHKDVYVRMYIHFLCIKNTFWSLLFPSFVLGSVEMILVLINC